MEGPGGGPLTVVVCVTHPLNKSPAKGHKYLIFIYKSTKFWAVRQTLRWIGGRT